MEIRAVERSDIPVVYKLLQDFAAYQNVEYLFKSTQKELELLLCEKGSFAISHVGVLSNKIIAFSCVNMISSTFFGGKGLHIEDLYIVPKHRGKGYGTQILKYLSNFALGENCRFMQWEAYADNKKAINFYEKIGASSEDIKLFLLKGDKLKGFGSK